IGSRSSRTRPDHRFPNAEEVIAAIHAAGGIASFAHPLTSMEGLESAAACVEELRAEGLDAIEARYALYSEAEQSALEEIADRNSLLVTCGSDFHGPERSGETTPFVEFPAERWRALRDAVVRTGGTAAAEGATASESDTGRPVRPRKPHPVARIAAPTASAILLFVVAVFGIVLPQFERVLLDRKKEMIRELTQSVHSMLSQYEADVQRGQVSEASARASAIEHLRGLRYGPDGRDYFWVTDRRPVMIVHPYRTDLEGTDVGNYRDASGKRVFHLFLEAVAQSSEGYVEYLWQWQDDASRIVPKLSFVKRFDPWGWVIGTGIYLDDVHAEIRRLEHNMRIVLAVITAVASILVLFIAHQGLSAERSRQAAQASLTQAYERYRALSESRTEGLIMTIDGACTFANETARMLLGYSEDDISLLRVSDIVGPSAAEDQALEKFVDILARGGSYQCVLKHRDSTLSEALLAASPFELGGRRGSILSFRPVSRTAGDVAPSAAFPDDWPATLPVGLLRTRWNPTADILWINEQAVALLGLADAGSASGTGLFDLIDAQPGHRAVIEQLDEVGNVTLTASPKGAAGRHLKLFIVAVRDAAGGARHLDAALVDISDDVAASRISDALRRGSETMPLFLGRSVGDIARPATSCDLEAGLDEVVRWSDGGSTLVTGPAGEPLGIIEPGSVERAFRTTRTDAARGLKAREVMEAPLLRLPADASLSEAVRLFGTTGGSTLLVAGAPGTVPQVVNVHDLLPAFGDGLWALRKEIGEAGSLRELRALRRRLGEVALLGLRNGRSASSVMRGLSELSDLVVQSLIDRLIGELGPAPGRFAFLVLGSEGRREMMPGSDQDNALVYDVDRDDAAGAEEYYARLANRVCAELTKMGVAMCPGGIMASNDAWRGDLAVWKSRLSGWIAEPNPAEVLGLSIFLDFRAQAGDAALAHELRHFLASLIADAPAFLPFLARDVADRTVPAFPRTGGLRDLVREGGPAVELKSVIAPIAGCARVLAVAGGLESTSTLSRLAGVDPLRALKTADRRELEAAYEFLLSLRLDLRLRSAGRDVEARDRVNLGELTQAEELLLRHAHEQAAFAQRLLAYRFLGAAP
ncbi:cache domain-containing protein, partial [Salinispira pacifica]